MVNVIDSGAKHAPHEMKQFLPGDRGNKYKIQPRKSDTEQALANNELDPFAMRDNEHPTTDSETLTHLLKASLGNLKYLAPVSMVANVFIGLGLGITFYYLVQDLPSIGERSLVTLSTLPAFFSITIFVMEAIGVVIPLENKMKTPKNFLGICGVLSHGMFDDTLIYMLLGFLGYLRYGITLNLRIEEWPAQAVKVLIALAVFCTFGLQFYVCLEIVWDGIKER